MSFRKNVLIAFQGTAVAQLIGFAIMPLLTRLYDDTQFGTYNVFTSVTAFVLTMAVLRYEIAIVSAETDDEALLVARLCLGVNAFLVLFSIGVCLAIYALGLPIADGFLVFIPIAFGVFGILQIVSYLALRFQDFRGGAASKIAQAISYSISAVLIGWASGTSSGLIFSDLFSRAAAAVVYFRRSYTTALFSPLQRNDAAALLGVARKYAELPLIALPAAIINSAGFIITPLLIYRVFGPKTTGQYALVNMSIGIPVGMICQAVSQVFLARFSEALRTSSHEAARLYGKIVSTHAKWGAIPTVMIMLFAPPLFPIVFGSTWRVAGQFAQVMAPLFFIAFVAAPINMSLTLMGRQKLQASWDIGRLIAVCALWGAVIHWKFTPHSALILHVAVNSVAYIIFLLMAFWAVQRHGNRRGEDTPDSQPLPLS